MPVPAEAEKFLWEGISFLTFLVICGGLMEPRLPRRSALLIGACAAAAIAALQAALLLGGREATWVLTMLPLTAYLPAVVCLHLLSRTAFFQTAAVWTAGAMAVLVLRLLRKLLTWALAGAGVSGLYLEGITAAALLAGAAALAGAALLVLRAPFRSYVFRTSQGWPVLALPVLMMAMLITYFMDTTTQPAVLLLLFLTAAAILLALSRALVSASRLARAEEERRAVSRLLEDQRREYEAVRSQLKLGRAYRHDMRHHLTVLEALARREGAREVLAYVEELGGRLGDTGGESYCENAPVNAVLSAGIARAREAMCAVTASVRLPGALPFDELDVCVVLGNALENAARACLRLAPERRRIRVDLELIEGGKLTLLVENPWDDPVELDRDGLPRSTLGEGHGVGLRSVQAVVNKYHGLLSCGAEAGMFRLRAVLFHRPQAPAAQPGPRDEAPLRPAPRAAARAALAAAALVLFVGCMPALADELERMPILGAVVRLADVCTYAGAPGGEGDGGTDAAGLPAPEGPDRSGGEGTGPAPEQSVSPGAQAELEQAAQDHLEKMREAFLWYASREYEGYVDQETFWQVVRSDGRALTVRFETTLNAGGSGQYSRYITLDCQTGEVLTLADLFTQGSDYITPISAEILSQMAAQVEAGTGDYFIPGGIWSEEECFRQIDPDQNFYISGAGELVIVFDEYEVAPGSMGMPEFSIPTPCLEGILARPSLLEGGA